MFLRADAVEQRESGAERLLKGLRLSDWHHVDGSPHKRLIRQLSASSAMRHVYDKSSKFGNIAPAISGKIRKVAMRTWPIFVL
ncbi:MAG: hypothetical protein ABIO49_04990 [Dokdonella sp.]